MPKAQRARRRPRASRITQVASSEALLSDKDAPPPEAKSSRAYVPTPKPCAGKRQRHQYQNQDSRRYLGWRGTLPARLDPGTVLWEIRQGKCTAADYVQEFHTVATGSGWSETALKTMFCRGLSLGLQTELTYRRELTTLSKIIKLAITIDNLRRTHQPLQRAPHPRTFVLEDSNDGSGEVPEPTTIPINPPAPVKIDREPAHAIHALLDSQRRNGTLQYLVGLRSNHGFLGLMSWIPLCLRTSTLLTLIVRALMAMVGECGMCIHV
ncbi:hypothetical protein P4O66_003551 [Electrophorus voltai]|uniref:Retrotransposon gag domain-containing protein n=1 Tax=Electrophorus voltai TaxID=2609070 RepID=A0AAD8ZTA9_9TELE|nr:hypothetical protein P4O66_003551 [Electrophorus voltai]